MRRWLRAAAMALALTLAATAAAGDNPDLPADIARVVARGELIVAINPNIGMPLCAAGPDGELRGLEPAIVRDLAKSLDVKVVFRRDDGAPDDTLALVRNREVDIAFAGLTMTAKRTLATPFGSPYAVLRSALFVNDEAVAAEDGSADSGKVIERLNSPGKRIAVERDSYHEWLVGDLLPRATAVALPDWESELAALLEDRVDAVLSDELRCVRTVRQSPEHTVFYSVYILKDRMEDISPAFHWGDHSLTVWYDAWMREKHGTPFTLAELIEEYPETFAARRAAPNGKDGDGK